MIFYSKGKQQKFSKYVVSLKGQFPGHHVFFLTCPSQMRLEKQKQNKNHPRSH